MQTLEQRLCQVTHDGKTYAGEVRQIEPRQTIKVWVPELQETLSMDWIGHGDDYENSTSSVNFYFNEVVNKGTFSSEKVTRPKRLKTS